MSLSLFLLLLWNLSLSLSVFLFLFRWQVSVFGCFIFTHCFPDPLSIFSLFACFCCLPFSVLVDIVIFPPTFFVLLYLFLFFFLFLFMFLFLLAFLHVIVDIFLTDLVSYPFDISASLYNTVHVPIHSSASASVSVMPMLVLIFHIPFLFQLLFVLPAFVAVLSYCSCRCFSAC